MGKHPPGAAITSACLLSAAGGSLDAWVYIGHGHVFANAQTGNVMLGAIALAEGHVRAAFDHLPPLLAFCVGILTSRLGGAALKRRRINSRSIRLGAEAVCLAVLAVTAGRIGNGAVTACVGFLAAVQITALSHIDGSSFNTGMTTGNLTGALSAASAAWLDPAATGKRREAGILALMCLCFATGACIGAIATFRLGDPALLVTAAGVLGGVAVSWSCPDPID